MTAKKGFFSRFRLVYKRSSPLLKCVVLATIVLSTVALIALQIGIRQHQSGTEAYRNQAALLERENSTLEEHIGQLGTVQSVKRIAMEKLGLVDPDTILIDTNNSNQE